jgi:hypothetical protein
MPIVPISRANITVSYINPVSGLVTDVSIEDANAYALRNPNTIFIFVDGDGDIQYLNIDQVNALTPNDLLRIGVCDTQDKKCGPPRINIYGGGGIGAKANPVVDVNGNLIAVDIVSGGFGYSSTPKVQVIDDCNIGSGALLNVEIENGSVTNIIVLDSGTGYLPPLQLQPISPQYPVVLELSRVIVKNPGINYDCANDELTITPNNGTKLSYSCDPFGKIKSVNVNVGGYFTELPSITINSNSGVNASFIPVFNIIRNPEEKVEIGAVRVVQVYDLVGLTINGYLDGKPYYGKVFYENGFKYAGVSNALGPKIAIYNTKQESIRQQSNQFLISEAIISQVQSNQTTSTLNNNDSTTIIPQVQSDQTTSTLTNNDSTSSFGGSGYSSGSSGSGGSGY